MCDVRGWEHGVNINLFLPSFLLFARQLWLDFVSNLHHSQCCTCAAIAQKYTILQLFLVANMLTTCWFLPLLAGLWDVTTDFVGESGAVFGGSISILTSLAYSSGILWNRADSPSQAIMCGTW